jgi:hypothetical protein
LAGAAQLVCAAVSICCFWQGQISWSVLRFVLFWGYRNCGPPFLCFAAVLYVLYDSGILIYMLFPKKKKKGTEVALAHSDLVYLES